MFDVSSLLQYYNETLFSFRTLHAAIAYNPSERNSIKVTTAPNSITWTQLFPLEIRAASEVGQGARAASRAIGGVASETPAENQRDKPLIGVDGCYNASHF